MYNKSLSWWFTAPTIEEENERREEWTKVSRMSEQEAEAYYQSWRHANDSIDWFNHGGEGLVPSVWQQFATCNETKQMNHSYSTWAHTVWYLMDYMRAYPNYDLVTTYYLKLHNIPEIEEE